MRIQFRYKFADRMKRLWRFMGKNRGQLIYYGGVALVLCAFACGAEQIRARRMETPQEEVLPVLEQEAIVGQTTEEERFQLAGDAQILRAYAAQPQWSSESGCWQCHMGMDIAFESGQVASLCEGTVQAVGESAAFGGFVEVQSGEYCLRYCSIEPDASLYAGREIAAGESIGLAAENMPGERNLDAHLHLEILRGDACINPAELLENAP